MGKGLVTLSGTVKSSTLIQKDCSPGFFLFARELLERNKPLYKRVVSDNKSKQIVLFSLWSSLTIPCRKKFETRAHMLSKLIPDSLNNCSPLTLESVQKSLTIPENPKKNSFASKKCPANLVFRSPDFSGDRCSSPLSIASGCKFKWNNMMYYCTFTDMLLVVAPTKKHLYAELLSFYHECRLTKSFLRKASILYERLSEEDRSFLSPIRNEERKKFESFCAHNCGAMEINSLDIIQLYAAFRHIRPIQFNELQKVRLSLYQALLASDTIHDSDFLRARRAMTKLKMQRSSEAGLYLSRKNGVSRVVRPSAYNVKTEPGLDDIKVAELLVDTRAHVSVYDDILDRANSLRTQKNAAQLCLYHLDKNMNNYADEHVETLGGSDLSSSPSMRKTIENALSKEGLAPSIAPRPQKSVLPAYSKHKRSLLARRTSRIEKKKFNSLRQASNLVSGSSLADDKIPVSLPQRSTLPKANTALRLFSPSKAVREANSINNGPFTKFFVTPPKGRIKYLSSSHTIKPANAIKI